ncbi:helix-turn-helix domain-containing protein [Pseudomonas sp. LRF_L74]|uniref:helix-turn-helix domain-containing protein n=1 Tax=Pseudomonas sp. LRF_L74 TaxID=3369422 RepID=UPI003F60F325
MTYRLSAADISLAVDVGRGAWQRTQIPEELGIGYADRLILDDGLSLACSCYRPGRDLCEQSVIERDEHALIITVAMAGASSYQSGDGREFAFKAGHTTVTAFRQARGERLYRADEEVRQVRLIVAAPVLRKCALEGLLDDRQRDRPVCQLFHGVSDAASAQLAGNLARLHGQQGGVLDLQIAALSLLAEQARRVASPASVQQPLRSDDQERLLRARDILVQQFDRPLTVAYLCATVGINEFKFKQAFRELFGTSPHRMLTDIRMRRAWTLLEAGEQAASVGYKVGYQHPSSFSAAFQKHFGRTPKSIAPGRG